MDITSHAIRKVSGLVEALGYHISCYRKGLRIGMGRSWTSHLMAKEMSQVWKGKDLDITSQVIGRVCGLVLEALRYISWYSMGLRIGMGRSWISHLML